VTVALTRHDLIVHRNASTRANPVCVVGNGPMPRLGGLQRSLVPWVTGCGFFFGPRPFSPVLTMKWAPWTWRETFMAHRISLIVQFSCVSLVKKPRTPRSPSRLSA
jgi:hypothetical protein